MVKEYNELFSPSEMQNPFDAIKEVDAEGARVAELAPPGTAKYEKLWRILDKTIRLDFDKLIEGIE